MKIVNPGSYTFILLIQYLSLLCDWDIVKIHFLVSRMIKYTGYGNCSGLLAQLGLLRLNETYNKGEYSSDSEDSDTEEYTELKDK